MKKLTVMTILVFLILIAACKKDEPEKYLYLQICNQTSNSIYDLIIAGVAFQTPITGYSCTPGSKQIPVGYNNISYTWNSTYYDFDKNMEEGDCVVTYYGGNTWDEDCD